MTLLNETTGQTAQCDGCGRTDAGPPQPLHIREFAVHDPNVGGGVLHHYCLTCAGNRGLADAPATIAGWEAAPPPAPDEPPAA